MLRKKYLLAGLLGLGLLVNLAQTRRAAAFNEDGKATPVATLPATAIGDKEELTDLLVKMATLSAKIVELGYTVAHIEVDRLQKGQIYSSTRTFYGGNNYRIVGIGGRGISDLDMKLVDSAGTTVAKDTEADNVPVVDVTPKAEGSYIVKVAASAMEKGFDPDSEYYFCWIIAFKR